MSDIDISQLLADKAKESLLDFKEYVDRGGLITADLFGYYAEQCGLLKKCADLTAEELLEYVGSKETLDDMLDFYRAMAEKRSAAKRGRRNVSSS